LNNQLTKEECLSSKKAIDGLFKKGKSFFLHPFRIHYFSKNESSVYHAHILVAVSKKSFKSAVKRNRIKRLIREAYRLNKNSLLDHLDQHNKSMDLGLIYIGETILDYQEIERKLILILQRLIEQDEEHIG
jgi:ribonuclease P protein component